MSWRRIEVDPSSISTPTNRVDRPLFVTMTMIVDRQFFISDGHPWPGLRFIEVGTIT